MVSDVNLHLYIMAGKRQASGPDTSGLLEEVRRKSKENKTGFHAVADAVCVRPMLEVKGGGGAG